MVNRPQRTPEQQEYRDELAGNLKDFRSMWDTGKELAKTLLDREERSANYILAKYWKTKEWALALIDSNEERKLAEFPDSSLDQEVVDALIESGFPVFVLRYPNLFKKPIDIDRVIDKMIDDNDWDYLAEHFWNLKNFKDDINNRERGNTAAFNFDYSIEWYRGIIFRILNHANRKIPNNIEKYVKSVVKHIDDLDWLSKKDTINDITNWLIKNGKEDIILANPDLFWLKKQ